MPPRPHTIGGERTVRHEGSSLRMRAHVIRFGLSLVVIWVSILAGLGCDNSPVASEASDWKRENPGSDANLYAVWGTAADNVFAVGGGGLIVHYDGSRWSSMVSGITSDLYAVYGRSSDDVYAAGANGQVLHYDGTAWYSLSNISLGVVHDVWTAPGQSLYVCGSAGEWCHDGNLWRRIAGGVVGQAMQGFVGRVHPALSEELLQLIVVSGNAVSYWTRGTWDYAHWPLNRAVRGLWGLSSGNLFAVCRDGYVFSTEDGIFKSGRPTQVHLNAVHGRSSKCVYAVGSNGKIIHYDGDKWTELPTSAPESLAGVWVGPGGEVFAVGYQGVVLHYSP